MLKVYSYVLIKPDFNSFKLLVEFLVENLHFKEKVKKNVLELFSITNNVIETWIKVKSRLESIPIPKFWPIGIKLII